jgi:transcriptional regulator with XRE-family HTH domain
VDIAGRFGANVAGARQRADLSQEELGVRASLHRTEISCVERGMRVIRIDTLVKLAGGLGVDPGVLLAGISWQPGETRRGRFSDPQGR